MPPVFGAACAKWLRPRTVSTPPTPSDLCRHGAENRLAVLAEGTIAPCVLGRFLTAGNVAYSDLDTVLDGERWRGIRQMYRHAMLGDGLGILDAGTGSRYGAALLTARFGDRVLSGDVREGDLPCYGARAKVEPDGTTTLWRGRGPWAWKTVREP